MAWLSDDFLIGQNWRSAPVASVTDYLVQRAHRRYALTSPEPSVTEAWELLSAYQESMYRLDISVQDFDGVKLLPGGSNWDWTTDHSGTQSSSDCLPSVCAFTTLPFALFHAAIGGTHSLAAGGRPAVGGQAARRYALQDFPGLVRPTHSRGAHRPLAPHRYVRRRFDPESTQMLEAVDLLFVAKMLTCINQIE